jgi:hypothetical protein
MISEFNAKITRNQTNVVKVKVLQRDIVAHEVDKPAKITWQMQKITILLFRGHIGSLSWADKIDQRKSGTFIF